MSSNKADANPVPATITSGTANSHDETDKINFLNLQCDISNDYNKKASKNALNDVVLKERLVAVLVSCHSALHQTKHLTDNYVSLEILFFAKRHSRVEYSKKSAMLQSCTLCSVFSTKLSTIAQLSKHGKLSMHRKH